MRILIVDTCYPAFLQAHYRDNPTLRDEPYAVQWRSLMDAFFGTADSYSHHLTALGHPSHEFVVNCEPLQAAWAAEHDVAGATGHDGLLLAQAEAYQPDVCYVQNLEVLHARTLRELSRRGHLVVGQLSTEPPKRSRLELFDLLVSPVPFLVDGLRARGKDAEHLPLAFDDRVLSRVSPQDDAGVANGAVFVGSLKRFRRWRSNTIVERAAREVDVEFWGYGATQWPRSSPIRRNYHGEAWGLDMFRVLAGGRVAINRHGDFTKGYACNMRLYEATGIGTMLLTDGEKGLDKLFEPGREVVTYTGSDDLAAKLRYYLTADDERRAIASAGHARTLASHTYAHRMSQLSEILTSYLSPGGGT